NFLHLAGAYRFASFARLEGAIGRVLLAWLCTFAALLIATRLFEPVTAADGPWAATWFSGALILIGFCRYALWRRMQHWHRVGRQLVEVRNRLCLVPVHVRLCPDAFGLRLGAVQSSHIAGHTFLNVIDRPLSDWRLIAKEVEDRLLGAAILAMISPLLLAIAL